MKKILILLLVLATSFSFAACSTTGAADSTEQVEGMIEELRTALTALIDENSSKIVQLGDEYSEKIAMNTEKDKTLEKSITSLKSEYDKKLEELVDGENGYNQKMSDLEALGAENSEKISGLKASFESKVAEIEAAIALDKADLSNHITEYEALAAELRASIASNKAEIDALKNSDGSEDTSGEGASDISALEAKVAELEAELDSVTADYGARISALEASIDSGEGDLEDTTTDYTAKLAELEAEDAAIKASVEALKAELNSAIEAAKAEYDAKLEVMNSERAEISASLAQLRADFDSKLADLEGEATALLAIDTTLTEAGKAADAKAVGDAISAVSGSIDQFSELFEPKPIYGYKYTDIDVTSEEYENNRKGYYLGTSGKPAANSSYAYSEMIEVKPGDIVHVTGYYPNKNSSLNYANQYSMRMICVYNSEGVAQSSLGLSVGSGFKTFEVPEGGAYVSVTYTMGNFKSGFVPVLARYTPIGETFILKDSSNSEMVLDAVANIATMMSEIDDLQSQVAALDVEKIQQLSTSIHELTAKVDALDIDKLNESIENIKNLDVNNLNIIASSAIGSPSISATADKLVPGAKIELENNTVINNKNLTFTCDLAEGGIGEGLIRLGHGKTSYGASYIEITAKTLTVMSYSSGPSVIAEVDHGLTLKDYVSVSIDADYHWATINISTATGYYTYQKNWQGRNGAIFAEVEGTEVTNVGMRWYSEDYQKSIWMVGDSYFNSKDGSRWTSYLISAGYKDFLMMSYPGMATERGLTEVKQALSHGTPKYIVWCMGMNNGDSISEKNINATYLSATQEFLEICEEKGITPILTTIPSTPVVLNEYKNAWVRNWAETTGGRYIDFARAVSDQTYNEALIGQTVTNTSSTSEKTNKTGYQWYDNMLHGDAVHPGILGAEALFMQALVDFPELMKEN